MDADVADLERALEAVKARSTRALANEELYQARIKELERMNRALVLQVASLGKGEAAGNVALAGAAADVAAGEASSVEGSPRRDLRRVCSYKTLRTKSNHLSVERIDLDADAGSDSDRERPPLDASTTASALARSETIASASAPASAAEHNPCVCTVESLSRDASEASLLNGGAGITLGGLGGDGKSPFQLVLCNDDGCEVREPPDRAIRTRQHSAPHSQFSWIEPPRNVLVIKKPNDKYTTAMMPAVVAKLADEGITAWVEPVVHWETGLGKTWEQDEDPGLDRKIDFIICLGGDGTILWVSNLFPRACPPVISFAMGSLGFLTAFEEDSIPRAVDDVVRGDFFFTMRSRVVAHVVDAEGNEDRERHVCLNEVVIDRGASAALVDLDVNIDGNPMTKVLADGVLISTPTGSTAYSLAAGGSMVHPGVSGVLVVPICPHTLSFRPLVLPDTVVLTIKVPETARIEPVASFDGKKQRRLKRGESLVVAGWRFPVPAICKSGETGDWFRAVKDSLLWNVRGSFQKPNQP